MPCAWRYCHPLTIAIEALRFGDLMPHYSELDATQRLQIAGMLPPGTPAGDGAEPFFRFMKEELQPALTNKYPVDTRDTTLWGHSLGGLFVVETLFKHPSAFRNYIASSPSIHAEDRRVLKDEAGFVKAMGSEQVKPRVLILVGQNEQRPYPKDQPLPPEMTGVSREELDQATASARMVDNARELAERLRKVKGVTVQYRLFEDEGHLSVVPASLSRAVTFGFGGAAY